MKNDLRSVIQKTIKFLNKGLLDDEVLALEDHLSFESMKNNLAVNFEPIIEFYKTHNIIDTDVSFIRSGVIGEGKQKMSPELVKIFDEWEEKCLGKSGLILHFYRSCNCCKITYHVNELIYCIIYIYFYIFH